MPERPLLLFGRHEDADKAKRHGGPGSILYPSHDRQRDRLSPKFSVLQSVLDRGTIAISQNPGGTDADYTLVFEAAGDPQNFITAIQRLQAEYTDVDLQFETDKEDMPYDEDFYTLDSRGDKENITIKYYCVFTNRQALDEILSLWNHFSTDENYHFPRGKAGLKNIFKALKDVHLWGIKERFEETYAMQTWQDILVDPAIQNITGEIELVYRHLPEKRNKAEIIVKKAITDEGGNILARSCIEEINYHALLVSIPRYVVEQMIQNPENSLANLNVILFIRPAGQMAVDITQNTFNYETDLIFPETINDEPILALFDGLPQENHPIIERFLNIDDPDDYTASYQVKDRQHGTAMASLIAWGDLNSNPSAIAHKIYVRPIMKPVPTLNDNMTIENVPENVLFVDQLHVAVRNLYEAAGGNPTAPSVRIINLSIGIKTRPFYNLVSPLAKLFDWLSFKYKVLFIVSAGNYNDDLDLGVPFSEFKSLSGNGKNKVVMDALVKRSNLQKIIAPAESINALTVGALFADSSSDQPGTNQVIPCSYIVPNPISALGRGINHSIKPDLLIPGGRNLVSEDMIHHNRVHWRRGSAYPPGILSAKPFGPIQEKSVGYASGTSNAAAILSHNAMICYDVLDEIFKNEEMSLPQEYIALLLKAMLVHGCKWEEATISIICAAMDIPSTNRLIYPDKVHRFIGHGIPNIEKVMECAKNRVTLIGYDELKKDSAHVYSVPIPFDFTTRRIVRNLTITLASFTPIKPAYKKYRQSQIWFTFENGADLIGKRLDASDKAVVRGTLQHERYSSEEISTWNQEDLLRIKVNCREDAEGLTENVPYALFVTFEITSQTDIDVYARVRERILPQQKVHA
jgi:hypothetical protein